MFVYRRKAHYHETDQMGIIHHANYVKWMEEARIEYLDSIGMSYKLIEESGISSPVAGISLDYKEPVYFDDIVELRLSVSKYTGVVMEFRYEFYDVTKAYVSTIASSKHCFVKEGKLTSLKRVRPDFHERLVKEAEQGTADD